MIGTLWKYFSTGALIYSAYNKLKTLSSAKNEFYDTLDPEQKAQWVTIFGNPYEIPPPVVPFAKIQKETVTPQTNVAALPGDSTITDARRLNISPAKFDSRFFDDTQTSDV